MLALELPEPVEEELSFITSAILNGVAVYKSNKQAPTLAEAFVDALAGCACLLSEGRHERVKNILQDVDHFALLEVLANHRMHSKNIYELIPLITDGKEVEFLRKLSPVIVNTQVSLEIVHDELDLPPVIEILAQLLPLFPTTYRLPRQLDLSCLVTPFLTQGYSGRFQSPYSPWMFGKYFATTIYYFDHGAFDQLSDKASSRSFFNQILTFDIFNPDLWEDEEEQWQFTVKRAKYYLEILDALDAGV